jgi:hypothetical protein
MAVYQGIKFDFRPIIYVVDARGPYSELIHDSFLGEGLKVELRTALLSRNVFASSGSDYIPEKASDSKAEGLKLIRPGRKFKILKTGE